MRLGILGLPQGGKSTLFEILVAGAPARAPGARKDQVGVVRVPDARVDRLSAMYSPKKTTYATLEVVDSQAMGQGSAAGKSGDLFASVRNADALVLVVRGFDDPAVPHPRTTIDPARDLADLKAEIVLNDLAIVETRLERIGKQKRLAVKGQDLSREEAVLARCKEALDREQALREIEFDKDDVKALSGFQLLSRLPLLVVYNTGSGQAFTAPAPRRARHRERRAAVRRRARGGAASRRRARAVPRGLRNLGRRPRAAGALGVPPAGSHLVPHRG